MSRRFGYCAALVAVALVGCKAKSTTSNTPTLQRLEASLAHASIPKGQPVAIFAHAVYSDGSRTEVSVHATWGTSAPFIATVGCSTTSCVVTSTTVGRAILTASFEGKSATVTLDVASPVAVTLVASVASPNIPKGTSTYVNALSDFSDTSTYDVSSSATWTSSDEGIAKVTCPDGLCSVTGIGIGTATLTATFDTLTATTTINVDDALVTSLALSESVVTLGVAATQTVQATGTLSDQSMTDVSSLAVWTTSNSSVATVAAGVITAVGGGEATITASVGVRSASLSVLVEAHQSGLVITTAAPTVALGASFQLGADGVFENDVRIPVTAAATWSSSDTSVAVVSAGGLVATGGSGRTMGTTTITAEYGGFSDTTLLTVGAAGPASVAIAPVVNLHANDAPVTLRTNIVDTNGVTRPPVGAVTFAVSNQNVATVDANGRLSPRLAGVVTITATADGVSGTLVVQVGGPLLSVIVSPHALTISIAEGLPKLFSVAGLYQGSSTTSLLTEGVTWTSSDSSVFVNVTQASPAQALVGCNSAGTSTVTATVVLGGGAMMEDHATVTCQ